MIPHFAASGNSEFYARYEGVGGSPGGVVRTALTDPWRLAEVAFDGRGLAYLGALALPLAGLWAFAPLLLVAATPELALNLLSSTRTQTSIHFHYTAAVLPGLVGAWILGAGRLARRRPRAALRLGHLALACSLVANYLLGAIPLWRYVPGGEALAARASRVTAHDRVAARGLRLIPPDAAVITSNTLGAHLSERLRILSFPRVRGAAWVAVDATRPSYLDRANAPAAFGRALEQLRRDSRWQPVFDRDGVLVLKRAP